MSGLAALALVAAAVTGLPPSAHVVIVDADGWPRALSAEEVRTGGLPPGVDHLWWWSEGRPPRRAVPPVRWREAMVEPAAARLAVTVKTGRTPRRPRDRSVLLAAPARMWEEVPESLLPRFSVPASGAVSVPVADAASWRLRAVGPERGSWWVDVPAGQTRIVVVTFPSHSPTIRVHGPDGTTPERTWAYLKAGDARRSGGGHVLAALVGDPDGRIVADRVPDEQELTVVVMAERCVPLVLRGRVDALPAAVTAVAGATLRGRVVDADGDPVPGAAVAAEFWASDAVPFAVRRTAQSGPDGTWEIDRVRLGEVQLSVARPGSVGLDSTLAVDSDDLDLGDLVLVAGLAVPALVVDDTGLPVEGARLRAASGAEATTDDNGAARLVGVSATKSVVVEAAADGHVPATSTFPQPLPETLRIELTRAFTVTGEFRRRDGTPVADGDVRVEQQRSWRPVPLTDGGRFVVDLAPGTSATLTLLSPSALRTSTAVAPGTPGEHRDLGVVAVPGGVTVRGVAIGTADGAPVAGARVWTVRPSPEGPLVAWMLDDVARGTTDADGAFALGGLPPGPALIRIDAPGHARLHVAVEPEPGEHVVDVGTVLLDAGTAVTIRLEGRDADGAVAEIDLRQRGLPFDVLTAPVKKGRAVFEHVGEGGVTWTVKSRRTVLCEDDLVVDGRAGSAEVVCESAPLTVSGEVLVGDEPAGRGQLVWRNEERSELPSGIMNVTSPGGLRRQATYSLSPDDVPVDVAADGTFETDELRPGRWQVSWRPASGPPSAPRPVDVPDRERFETTLVYPDFTVSGIVVDSGGEPAAEAHVEVRPGGGLAVSGPDGRFAVAGLDIGHWTLEARRGDEVSSPVEAVVAQDGRSKPVTLVLEDGDKERIDVVVRTRAGIPASGAFVVVETSGGDSRIASAGVDGRVQFSFRSPRPTRLRLAARVEGTWVLAPWSSWEVAQRGVVLAAGRTGTLSVTAKESRGRIDLTSADGWNVGWLSARLGAPLLVNPARPLKVSGLPPGRYTVTAGTATASASVQADRTKEVELP